MLESVFSSGLAAQEASGPSARPPACGPRPLGSGGPSTSSTTAWPTVAPFVLSVVDVFSRSSEVLEAGSSFTGERVAALLERAAAGRLPEVITADHGTEFTSKAFDAWAFERGVKLDFTTPGKPTENGFVESFQGRFRDECLNAEIFHDLEDAKRKTHAWRDDYNRRRPHSALGNLSPREYLRRWYSEARSKKPTL
jgi:transposase InsO family protein